MEKPKACIKKPTRSSIRPKYPVNRYVDEFKVMEFLATHDDDETPLSDAEEEGNSEDAYLCQRYGFSELRAMLNSVDGAHLLPPGRLDDIASSVDGAGTRTEVMERLEELVDEEMDAIEDEDDFFVSEAESSNYDEEEEEEEGELMSEGEEDFIEEE